MKTVKYKKGTQAYENWLSNKFVDGSNDFTTNLDVELSKAEPDLLPAPEIKQSDELEAALTVLNNGGLTKLTAIQQKVFQLSVVEGMSNRDVAERLKIGEKGVREHVKAIGKKLRKLAVKLL